MEKLLGALWKKLLKIEDISLEDNFFRLGGDSVLSMQLVSIARARGVTLTVQDRFRNANLRGLAQAVVQCGVPANQIEDVYRSTFLQRRMIISQKRASSEPRDYQAQLVFALPESLDVEQFQAAWNSASRRHSILRTRLIRFDNMKFEKALGRFAIVQGEGNNERNFVLRIQHAIYDAFSFSLLFSEVEKTYLGTSPSISMPPEMNSYIKYLVEADRHAAVGLWSSYLAGTDTKPLHRPGEPFPNITLEEVQRVSDLLHAAQAFQGEMLQHEHLGFFELNKMEDLSPILQNSYHVNVNSAPTVHVDLNAGRLELNIRSDDDYVPEVKVKEILADIRNVISRFVQVVPGEGTTVGEIIGE
ncbi:putative Carrier domain-containing protein [Seiridium cardinale]|uniref:Carrier domain-containing protein n=1 Tax=Seiridium cardinale TaxID=138064 RepID=A0ABR2XPI8_9PEZI